MILKGDQHLAAPIQESLQTLLDAHARSFALSLRLLPSRLRETPSGLRAALSLGYLLARASDTIADAGGASRARRLALLRELQIILESRDPLHWRPEFGKGEMSESERALMEAMPMLLDLLGQSPDRIEIQKLWRTILKGQIFDLVRFYGDAEPLSQVELEEYCYLVAGSVGESWTQLIDKHSPQTLLLPIEDMEKLGMAYGKGLQLLNILRDRHEDRELGRVYVQEKDMSEMLDQAVAWLGEGESYCHSLKQGRIRYATELPWRLAMMTLKLMRTHPDIRRVKIKRWEVYRVLLQAIPSLVLRRGKNPAS